jgi:uncharacterized protein
MYKSPDFHLFESNGKNLLVPDGSRIYGITDEIAKELEQLAESKDNQLLEKFLKDHGFHSVGQINDEAPVDPPLTAISLAIAQKCNLGCTYCYAQQGDFGVRAKNMSVETGIAAVDMMFANNTGSNKMNLAFLGGEPLANRAALQIISTYASEKAVLLEKEIHFSITTNGTLLNKEDAEFFEDHGFAVTISIDGIGEEHDRLRPMKNGKGSYDRLIQQVKPLLEIQKNMQVSARVTVTPSNLNLKKTLNELIALGFHGVGFSPMLSSPNGKGEMDYESLETMLENMIDCGREFEKNLIAGKRYPFSNMTNAIREIHRGTHRPYPCGAGAGYLGVSADGELAACHRFVEDEKGKFGNLREGVNRDIQRLWLNERHVHRQEPCKSCWARYLCGGGCHHEVIHRGRPACDYIRGWLHYTLQAYTNLLKYRPDYFSYHNQT